LLGKVLRIDVDGDDFPMSSERNYRIPDSNPFADVRDPTTREVITEVTGDDEIWASGLRNPYRASFDRLTHDLWIGDVGQSFREEINYQPADWPGGANYGWRLREGKVATATPLGSPVGGDPPPGNVDPVYDYLHGSGSFRGNAVIGGYVYRGPDPSLQGQYFFADAVSSHKWKMDTTTYTVVNIDDTVIPDVGTVSVPVGFGEDAVGNLYIVDHVSGSVFRINTTEVIAGDYNADGVVDGADYDVWKTDFGSTTILVADGNGDNIVGAADYTVWRNHFGNTVHNLGAGSGGTSVPEPIAMFLLGQVVTLTWSRRGWRSL
jgi:hypothetical protein